MAELGWTQAGDVLEMILPVSRPVAAHAVEPYVIAADVYGVAPHVGRGGWTWYTGSAAWTYRVVLESVLGVRVEGEELVVAPCLPAGWPEFRVRTARADVEVRRGAAAAAEVDGTAVPVVDGVVRMVLGDRMRRIVVTIV